MKNKMKMCFVLSLIMVMFSVYSGTAFAATSYPTSAAWSVNYTAGAPSGSANPVSYKTITYSSSGFYTKCTAITGSNDRKVTVTNTNLGGFTNGSSKYITSKGTSATWKTVNSTTGGAEFKFVASGATSCSASGTIYRK